LCTIWIEAKIVYTETTSFIFLIGSNERERETVKNKDVIVNVKIKK